MNIHSKIFVAGHKGMVGSSITKKLESLGYKNLILRSSTELDLINQHAVNSFFESEKPDYVFMAAAKVGGINANNIYRGEFIYNNLMIESNVIHASFKSKVKRLLFMGSSCVYPKFAPQPLKEEYLLTGSLEPTNEPYAIAKIAGIKLCESYRTQYGCDFFSVMPTNLYGPGDNYDLDNSHVLPALLRKFHEAKMNNSKFVEVWGSGKPRREFMFVEDLAEACILIMNSETTRNLINIGVGEDICISELANIIKDIVGFEGEIHFDLSKPDGTPRKLLDVSLLESYGIKARMSLETGIRNTYKAYLESIS